MSLIRLASLFCVIGFCYGSDVVYIEHVPSYYTIGRSTEVQQQLKSSELSHLVLATLGFSIPKDFHWDAIKADSFFKRPQAAGIMQIDAFDNVMAPIAQNSFPLTVDEDPSNAYPLIASSLISRYPEDEPITMGISSDEDVFGVVSKYEEYLPGVNPDPENVKDSKVGPTQLKHLQVSNIIDRDFIAEMQLFSNVTNALVAKKEAVMSFKSTSLFWFQSVAFKYLKEAYGLDSPQVKEALKVIKNVISQMNEAFNEIYKDNYVFFVLTVDFLNEIPKSRLGRSLLQDEGEISGNAVNASDINLSESYDEDYPAMFNIIFFVSLLLSLSVFAIALGMWHIDPGRDSIIYRMTSQRMKKDN